ncbi:MAG: ABC transporter permease [candidate division Zixibacteria bacterium]
MHYIKSAIRNIWKNKSYSIISMIGLSVGLSCCFALFIFVNHELSFDSFHSRSNEIYRVVEEMRSSDGFFRTRPYTGTPLAPLVEAEVPSVEHAIRISLWEGLIKYEENCFREKHVCFADPAFFDLFSFPILTGDSAKSLSSPNSVLISDKMAKKYFGEENPTGKTIIFENAINLTVTGIIDVIPANSHLQFDFVASFSTLENAYQGWSNHWDSRTATYLLLNDKESSPLITERLNILADKYRNNADKKVVYSLESVKDIHLRWDTNSEKLYIFAALAISILIIAIVNYINISTALIFDRLRGISMRKILGAKTRHIVYQFFVESFIITILGSLIALLFMNLFQTSFGLLSETGRQISFWGDTNAFLIVGLVTVLTGIVTGICPALVLSSNISLKIFGANRTGKKSTSRTRSGLVIFQFSCTVILLFAVLTVNKQYNLLMNKDLGYNKSGLIVIPIGIDEAYKKQRILKSEMIKLANVTGVAAASKSPAETDCNALSYASEEDRNLKVVPTLWIDSSFIKTMGVRLKDDQIAYDMDCGFILNESARKYLNLIMDNNLKTRLRAFAGSSSEGEPWYDNEVIGVVQDFHFRYLRNSLQPLIMVLDDSRCNYLLVRVNDSNNDNTIIGMQNIWKDIVGLNVPFEYSVLSDDLNNLYGSENKSVKILTYSSILSILIAALGLLGLSAFTVRHRMKEICIRKVLGASVISIISLLVRKYLLLVTISNLIALPIGFLLLNDWLKNFVYRVEPGWEIFVTVGILTIAIALVVVTVRTINAANINPAQILKCE